DGLLRGVDLQSKSFVMEVENGMDQTFNWDEDTKVSGVSSVATAQTTDEMKELMNRPGSELIVEWRDEGYLRFATAIDVRDMSTKDTPKSRPKTKVVR